jgi:hypothetical protein
MMDAQIAMVEAKRSRRRLVVHYREDFVRLLCGSPKTMAGANFEFVKLATEEWLDGI